ncbi:MAG TPA: hypothetical protein PKK60_01250 [archaeon]|nr:hypothetical protein [archaeon]
MKIINQKGLFNFIIVIIIIGIIFTLVINSNKIKEELEKTKNELIITEISQKEQIILENNVDKIIETKLREQILLKNFNSFKIQNEINTKLYNYLKDKANACDTISESKNTLTTNYLNNTTNAYTLQTENVSLGEYTFTSNLTKNQIICKSLGEKTKIEFRIPIGYNIKVIN